MTDAVVVLRVKAGAPVPEWLWDLQGVERLRDGAFLVPAGTFRADDTSGGEVRKAVPHDLSFHDDARGVRWMKLTAIPPRKVIECELPGHGRFKAYALDYEPCVNAPGAWVPAKAPTVVVPRKKGPDADEPQHRNVVVVKKAPKTLPKELIVLSRLPDGTALAVGPRNRGWVDWLKKNVPLEHLRLLRGPVPDSFIKEMESFEMLDAACRIQGQPLLVMKSE